MSASELDEVFAYLISLGFEDKLARVASKKFPGDLNSAIDYAVRNSQSDDAMKNSMQADVPSKPKRSMYMLSLLTIVDDHDMCTLYLLVQLHVSKI